MEQSDERLAAMPEGWERALAVVAHPDDMEYGAAAAVAEWTAAGKQVAYVMVTRGEAGIEGLDPGECARVREAEQQASAAAVGVTSVEFLGHPDGVIEEGVPLRRDIAAAVRLWRPELVVTVNHRETFGGQTWNTPDHRAVGRAVLDACGDAGNQWIFPEQLGRDGLEPWGGVRWVALAGSPQPTHAMEVGETAVERAVASLSEHRAYLAALSEEPVERQARSIVEWIVGMGADRFGGRSCVTFEVFPR